MGYSKETLVPLGNSRWDFMWRSEYNLAMQGKKKAELQLKLGQCYKGVQKTKECV